METIALALLGTGFGKTVHLPALHPHPRPKYKVEALWGRHLPTLQSLAHQYQIPHFSDNWQEIVQLPHIQVVSITTPPFLHFAQAEQALRAGKHLLLEKPIALNYQEAHILAQLAEERGLIIAIDFEFRCVPEWQYFQHLVAQGTIGKIRLITLEWLVSGRANPLRPWNWYSQKAQGGGALGALASHSFDYLNWIFGAIGGISARLTTAITHRPDPLGTNQPVDSDDTCSIYMELVDGTPIHMVISTVAHHGTGHWLTVYGDRGTLKLGSSNLKDYIHGFQIYQATPDAPSLTPIVVPPPYQFQETFADGRIAPVRAIYDRLADSIINGTPMHPDISDGLLSQQLIDLAHRSAQTGKYLDL